MNDISPADWGPCSPGELSRLAVRLVIKRVLSVAAVAAVAVSAAAGVTVAGWAAFGPTRSAPPPAGPSKKSSRKGDNGVPQPGRWAKFSEK